MALGSMSLGDNPTLKIKKVHEIKEGHLGILSAEKGAPWKYKEAILVSIPQQEQELIGNMPKPARGSYFFFEGKTYIASDNKWLKLMKSPINDPTHPNGLVPEGEVNEIEANQFFFRLHGTLCTTAEE